MLGVGTALGRTLLPGDAAVPEREPVIVVSFEAWQTMFAGRRDIIGTNQSLRMAATGVAIGVALALGLSRLLASHVVFMRVFDAPAFGAGALLVVATALAAGYVPSRRAARVDPIEMLRCD